MNLVNSNSDHPEIDIQYQTELMVLLLSKLEQEPLDFEKLVEEAEGAYPTDVMSALHALETAERISLTESGLWQVHSHTVIKPSVSHSSKEEILAAHGLPEPHPLDFDWRFTADALSTLERAIKCSSHDSIAVLGAPTLYKYLKDAGANAWLYDKNSSVVKHLRANGYEAVTECDLLTVGDLPNYFKWVVADPPWYLEFYERFLVASYRLLKPGGHLLLSMLPRLTRPSAAADRLHVVKYAASLGFDLIEVERGVLSYASPPFEIEALRCEGIAVKTWRKGDLFSFVSRCQQLHIDGDREQVNSEHWTTIALGNTTIRIKNESLSKARPFVYEAGSATGDPRLHSVSRRSPSRSRVNLWTSRNVALVLSEPRLLIDALMRIQSGELLPDVVTKLTNQFKLEDHEVKRLKEILDLLVCDAGLT